MLPASATQVVRAQGPGIYPSLPKAAYILARRKVDAAGSTFAAVLEPYGKSRGVTSISKCDDSACEFCVALTFWAICMS